MSDLVGNPEDGFSHNKAHIKTQMLSESMWNLDRQLAVLYRIVSNFEGVDDPINFW